LISLEIRLAVVKYRYDGAPTAINSPTMLMTTISSTIVKPCWVLFMAAQSPGSGDALRGGPTNGCRAPISGAAMWCRSQSRIHLKRWERDEAPAPKVLADVEQAQHPLPTAVWRSKITVQLS
jgi:hypothetical protein